MEPQIKFSLVCYSHDIQSWMHAVDQSCRNNHHHHHWAALVSRGWANASACRLQVSLSSGVLCQIVSLQYWSRSSLPALSWSHFVVFSYHNILWSPSGNTRGPSVVFGAVNMPCPGPFHFSHIAEPDYIWLLFSPWSRCSSFYPYVMLSILLSVLVCVAAGLVCACLIGVQVCAPCHSWQHTGVVHLSLQVDGKVAFEDVPVFGVCRPACHDSSLYLFVLVLFLDAVALSEVCVAFYIFYQHIVNVYYGVVYNHHVCLCDVHLKTHSPTFIG